MIQKYEWGHSAREVERGRAGDILRGIPSLLKPQRNVGGHVPWKTEMRHGEKRAAHPVNSGFSSSPALAKEKARAAPSWDTKPKQWKSMVQTKIRSSTVFHIFYTVFSSMDNSEHTPLHISVLIQWVYDKIAPNTLWKRWLYLFLYFLPTPRFEDPAKGLRKWTSTAMSFC